MSTSDSQRRSDDQDPALSQPIDPSAGRSETKGSHSVDAGRHNDDHHEDYADRDSGIRRDDETRVAAAPASGSYSDGDTAGHERVVETRDSVVAREREEHGGMKMGSAFFGWLTATGMAVLLTALVAAAGTAVGLATNTLDNNSDADQVANALGTTQQNVGIIGGVVLLVIFLIAYYSGGYVAGRMARFDGAKQGVGVWIWSLLMTALVAAVAAVGGTQYNIFSNLNMPSVPVSDQTLSTGGLIAIVAIFLVSLVAAVLGGLAGMRYHRSVDRTGLGA